MKNRYKYYILIGIENVCLFKESSNFNFQRNKGLLGRVFVPTIPQWFWRNV